jgi:hypothetical protein
MCRFLILAAVLSTRATSAARAQVDLSTYADAKSPARSSLVLGRVTPTV